MATGGECLVARPAALRVLCLPPPSPATIPPFNAVLLHRGCVRVCVSRVFIFLFPASRRRAVVRVLKQAGRHVPGTTPHPPSINQPPPPPPPLPACRVCLSSAADPHPIATTPPLPTVRRELLRRLCCPCVLLLRWGGAGCIAGQAPHYPRPPQSWLQGLPRSVLHQEPQRPTLRHRPSGGPLAGQAG